MRRAGIRVVATEDYYRRYDSRTMKVSDWEGHPNEVANQIFASMLENQLRNRPELEPYRVTTRNTGATPSKSSPNAVK